MFQVVGIAARIALSLRLHRRDDVYIPLQQPFNDAATRDKHNERRKSVFWGVYCLDRLTMHVLGLPPAIRDSDIDVDVSELETGERQVASFVRDIQDWYDSSPLKTAFVPITPATIAKQVSQAPSSAVHQLIRPPQSLDDLCFHQMILAIHRPSPLIPEVPSSFLRVLLSSSSASVDLYRHYWKSKQILINWIHYYQIFVSCISLVFCFCEHQIDPTSSP